MILGYQSSVVHRASSRTFPSKQLAGFGPNLAGMIFIWSSLKIVQMAPVHCISRSHRLKIGFKIKTLKNLLV